jgi:DNA mismatch endonuclease (patch repair protein)
VADRETSWATSLANRRTMQANRRRDTAPELALRRALHALGYRYRVDYPPLPHVRRRADIVFTRQRVAVFVDGCFWHCCPEHGTLPKSNADYWEPKLARNVKRDRETDAALAEAGWLTVRVWEHESIDLATARIQEALRSHPSTVG